MNTNARLIVAACVALMALMPVDGKAADRGPEDTTSNHADPAPMGDLFAKLQRAGCRFALQEGEGYKKITDHFGREYSLLFDEKNRLTEFSSAQAGALVVYEADSMRPAGLINKFNGTALRIPSGPGPAAIQSLIAQGKLPSVEKLLQRVCASQAAPKIVYGDEEFPDEYQMYMTQDYWEVTFWPEFENWWGAKPPVPPECQPQVECIQECTDRNIFGLLTCVVVAGTFAAVGAPTSGAIAGAFCAFVVQGAIFPECQRRCRVRYPC